MKPEDFGASLLDQAHRLRHSAIARNNGFALDEKSATWLLRHDQRMRLMRELEPYSFDTVWMTRSDKMKLLGIPIRITIDDDPSTPELQLVMEPTFMALR